MRGQRSILSQTREMRMTRLLIRSLLGRAKELEGARGIKGTKASIQTCGWSVIDNWWSCVIRFEFVDWPEPWTDPVSG